ncbi:hypothetical protein PHLGIDRAFT_249772 [Phlebiopsis gigantea 11061_1 CR5-6]|uniref:Uncharacterized protein n=1 Tax=Phlebiopsis gigantea (strain 11061_1 CR5-6) TaxID=745531 RepID=A0A0C3NY26_PHLG1|nr:hypothetical protein PHLGIDRAFT_249772 [Phlebiopsis gigantea 11061_1 CR5-6]
MPESKSKVLNPRPCVVLRPFNSQDPPTPSAVSPPLALPSREAVEAFRPFGPHPPTCAKSLSIYRHLILYFRPSLCLSLYSPIDALSPFPALEPLLSTAAQPTFAFALLCPSSSHRPSTSPESYAAPTALGDALAACHIITPYHTTALDLRVSSSLAGIHRRQQTLL